MDRCAGTSLDVAPARRLARSRAAVQWPAPGGPRLFTGADVVRREPADDSGGHAERRGHAHHASIGHAEGELCFSCLWWTFARDTDREREAGIDRRVLEKSRAQTDPPARAQRHGRGGHRDLPGRAAIRGRARPPNLSVHVPRDHARTRRSCGPVSGDGRAPLGCPRRRAPSSASAVSGSNRPWRIHQHATTVPVRPRPPWQCR